MREALRALDPKQPLSSFRTMDEIKSAAVDDQRFQMTLLGVFAGIGLLLAIAGVYGLVSYSAAQRTREFGIRMALGAPRGFILRAVVRSGAILAFVGVAIGIAASVASRTVLERFVWGISPLDPLRSCSWRSFSSSSRCWPACSRAPSRAIESGHGATGIDSAGSGGSGGSVQILSFL